MLEDPSRLLLITLAICMVGGVGWHVSRSTCTPVSLYSTSLIFRLEVPGEGVVLGVVLGVVGAVVVVVGDIVCTS